MKILNKAVFLDLNGTLVESVQVDDLLKLTEIPGSLEAVAKLNNAGYLTPVVTVQSRIAKGYFSQQEFIDWFEQFKVKASDKQAKLLGPYLCPHSSQQLCKCSKPNSLLFERSAGELDIDLSGSYMIGDTPTDVFSAVNFGGRGCMVKTGWGHFRGNIEQVKPVADYIGDNLFDVVCWILEKNKQEL